MPVSAFELFTNMQWQWVPSLIEDTQALYDSHVTPKGLGDQHSLAAEKIVPLRKWGPTQRLFKNNLLPIIRELGIFYVPKLMEPGPCIVFPICDHHNFPHHAMVKPMWPLKGKDGFPIKYAMLGKEKNEGCPTWFGDTDTVISAIGHTRSVVLVEGYFDLLACRLLHPGAPVMTSGTKRIGEPHMQWLRILGVKKVFIAFDNEVGRDGGEGAGNMGARLTVQQFNNKHGVAVEAVALPAKDPSACLEHLRSAYALRNLLRQMFPAIPVDDPPPNCRHPGRPATSAIPGSGA